VQYQHQDKGEGVRREELLSRGRRFTGCAERKCARQNHRVTTTEPGCIAHYYVML